MVKWESHCLSLFSLSLSHLPVTIAAFDPRPFIRTFENVLQELERLRTRVQDQCDELENSTQLMELQYKKDVADMQGAFEVNTRFFCFDRKKGGTTKRERVRTCIGPTRRWKVE